ncbi:aggregation-promoting factor [Limosilactobacillus reuteri]|uniref:aggregation-promoting factor n=1 Tax=Limosilactobacillus reuteri TaxID=1598 RepID=UPI001E426272|nr:LysM domain-containing protein [Limosilactobacillus reuteri]MCC4359115.1 LysM peptidoglycan-binding domain-containing protein [Limosilactobacillus reuteri]MCC4361744.1 LysM peptidoglycan-binding domain-containing protein [Limosilactobacillus reuteri]MCC4365419.1 LysM peptidoglycan-binding domain-containing protein [Limosilactobacillus reuteri]
MIFILNTKNNNGVKIALTAMGALALGLVATGTTANADTTIDSNHVQVEAGDTLSAIAQKHGTDVDTLVRENHIANKHLIHVGDKLVVMPDVKNTDVNGQDTDNHVTTPVTTPTSDQQTTTTNDTLVTQQAPATSGVSSNSAKEAIAQKESGGSYTATNGKYIGRYQLDASYLNGNYSIENQEKVAEQYVAQRYGSWDAALAFHNAHGWY